MHKGAEKTVEGITAAVETTNTMKEMIGAKDTSVKNATNIANVKSVASIALILLQDQPTTKDQELRSASELVMDMVMAILEQVLIIVLIHHTIFHQDLLWDLD